MSCLSHRLSLSLSHAHDQVANSLLRLGGESFLQAGVSSRISDSHCGGGGGGEVGLAARVVNLTLHATEQQGTNFAR